jgi:segregation and condensation protein B
MNIDQYIEAILFFKGTPLSISFLSKVLGKNEKEINQTLDVLESRLEGGGLVLIRHEDKVSLGTTPKASGFIEVLMKEELSRDIGKAGLEILSIIVYKSPISRGEIDHIRGVNSSFILRNLMIRGLIEKARDKGDQRVSLYKPTSKLLSFLGVSSLDKMPQYNEVRKDIEELEKEGVHEPLVRDNSSLEEESKTEENSDGE